METKEIIGWILILIPALAVVAGIIWIIFEMPFILLILIPAFMIILGAKLIN